MYCANCGAMASGNFCSGCGFSLQPATPGGEAQLQPTAASGPWEQEIRYAMIIAAPQVRDRIAANAARATTPMSGEQFLELCDKAFKPLTGISVSTVAATVAPVYGRLGINTGKTRVQTYAHPAGVALAEVLCALAANGYQVKQVQQGEDGCVLECGLPSDWRSFAGELVVTVERIDSGTAVRAATKIAGQLYDWGKSRQALDRLFARLESLQRG